MNGVNVMRGFSMIEVLVALLVIATGTLGMFALQAQALRHTLDANLRGNAVMLADDLLELMRSNRGALLDASGALPADESAYYKAKGQGFPSAPPSCGNRQRGAGGSGVAGGDLGCWAQQVRTSLPVDDKLLQDYRICRSAAPGTCSQGAGSAVMIELFWSDPRADAALCANQQCSYTLRAEL